MHDPKPDNREEKAFDPKQFDRKRGDEERILRKLGPKRERPKSSDGFGLERKGLGYGILGGTLMMLVAVVWFVLGMMGGIIFFYPPILFIIGCYGVVKGVLEGNVAGENRGSQSTLQNDGQPRLHQNIDTQEQKKALTKELLEGMCSPEPKKKEKLKTKVKLKPAVDPNTIIKTLYHPAGAVMHLLAWLIDLLVFFLLVFGYSQVFSLEKMSPAYLVLILLMITYKPLMEGFLGATVGKKLLKMEVRTTACQRVGIVRAFIRSSIFTSCIGFYCILVFLLPKALYFKQYIGFCVFLLILNLAFCLFRKDKRTLEDLIAGTMCYKESQLPGIKGCFYCHEEGGSDFCPWCLSVLKFPDAGKDNYFATANVSFMSNPLARLLSVLFDISLVLPLFLLIVLNIEEEVEIYLYLYWGMVMVIRFLFLWIYGSTPGLLLFSYHVRNDSNWDKINFLQALIKSLLFVVIVAWGFWLFAVNFPEFPYIEKIYWEIYQELYTWQKHVKLINTCYLLVIGLNFGLAFLNKTRRTLLDQITRTNVLKADYVYPEDAFGKKVADFVVQETSVEPVMAMPETNIPANSIAESTGENAGVLTQKSPTASAEISHASGNVLAVIDGRFELESVLNSFGNFTQFKAYDNTNKTKVIVTVTKTEIPNKDTLLVLNNPGVPKVLQINNITHISGSLEQVAVGDSFAVSELIPGISLAEKISSYPTNKIPEQLSVSLAMKLASLVDFLNSQGLYPAKLNSQTVNVTEGNDVKLDLFRALYEEYNNDAYTSPEIQAEQQFALSSNQYSVAVILYEMLTGSTAVPNDYVKNNDISYQKDLIIRTALSTDPEQRFKSCMEFISEFSVTKSLDINNFLKEEQQEWLSSQGILYDEQLNIISKILSESILSAIPPRPISTGELQTHIASFKKVRNQKQVWNSLALGFRITAIILFIAIFWIWYKYGHIPVKEMPVNIRNGKGKSIFYADIETAFAGGATKDMPSHSTHVVASNRKALTFFSQWTEIQGNVAVKQVILTPKGKPASTYNFNISPKNEGQWFYTGYRINKALRPGVYKLQMFINGKLFTEDKVTVTSSFFATFWFILVIFILLVIADKAFHWQAGKVKEGNKLASQDKIDRDEYYR